MCLECIDTEINLSYALKANTFIFFTEFTYVESEIFDFARTSNSRRFLCSEIIYTQHVIASFVLSQFGVLEGTSSVSGSRTLCTCYVKIVWQMKLKSLDIKYNMHYGFTCDGFCTRAREGKTMEGRIAITLRKTFLSEQVRVVSLFAECFETNFAFTCTWEAVLMSKRFTS